MNTENSERGVALIVALLVLSFLTVLGGALLLSATMDVRIGDNYLHEAQLLYLAEAGIEDAREILRTSATTPSELLAAAAGADHLIASSRDLSSLLAGDDVPIVNGGTRTTGKPLVDVTGRSAGRYFVFLRNDTADGMSSPVDSNRILTLLSIGVVGDQRKGIEVTIIKGRFPEVPAALTLNGTSALFQPADSNDFGLSGLDASGTGSSKDAIGAISTADLDGVLSAIPDFRKPNYIGSGPAPSIASVDDMLDPRLKSPAMTEQILGSILANATDVYDPGWNGRTELANVGSSTDYRIVVVNGDCEFAAGSGYGLLVTRGNLTLSDSFHWYGLILVIGQGRIEWSSGSNGQVSGAVFLATTREADRSSANPLGTLRAARGPVTAIFNDGWSNAVQFHRQNVEAANSRFPYKVIAVREY